MRRELDAACSDSEAAWLEGAVFAPRSVLLGTAGPGQPARALLPPAPSPAPADTAVLVPGCGSGAAHRRRRRGINIEEFFQSRKTSVWTCFSEKNKIPAMKSRSNLSVFIVEKIIADSQIFCSRVSFHLIDLLIV